MSEQAQEPTENTPGAADVAEQIGAEWEKSESRLGDGWNLEGRGRGSEESAPAADSSRAPADPPPADELEQDVEEDTEYASELAQDYAREAWLEQAAEWFETGEDPAEIAQYLLENVGAEAASAFYQVWKEEEQSEEEPVTADDWVWQQQANARAYEEAQQAELRAPECAPGARRGDRHVRQDLRGQARQSGGAPDGREAAGPGVRAAVDAEGGPG